ncbi:hypothetical protein B0H12DRAFT_1073000 [Mycena haematopus]|nr:hypothetical protein B0H12DRAFT_1073000 [Mycena haematopus]
MTRDALAGQPGVCRTEKLNVREAKTYFTTTQLRRATGREKQKYFEERWDDPKIRNPATTASDALKDGKSSRLHEPLHLLYACHAYAAPNGYIVAETHGPIAALYASTVPTKGGVVLGRRGMRSKGDAIAGRSTKARRRTAHELQQSRSYVRRPLEVASVSSAIEMQRRGQRRTYHPSPRHIPSPWSHFCPPSQDLWVKETKTDFLCVARRLQPGPSGTSQGEYKPQTFPLGKGRRVLCGTSIAALRLSWSEEEISSLGHVCCWGFSLPRSKRIVSKRTLRAAIETSLLEKSSEHPTDRINDFNPMIWKTRPRTGLAVIEMHRSEQDNGTAGTGREETNPDDRGASLDDSL